MGRAYSRRFQLEKIEAVAASLNEQYKTLLALRAEVKLAERDHFGVQVAPVLATEHMKDASVPPRPDQRERPQRRR